MPGAGWIRRAASRTESPAMTKVEDAPTRQCHAGLRSHARSSSRSPWQVRIDGLLLEIAGRIFTTFIVHSTHAKDWKGVLFKGHQAPRRQLALDFRSGVVSVACSTNAWRTRAMNVLADRWLRNRSLTAV